MYNNIIYKEAIRLAEIGLKVFPVWGVFDGKCGCGHVHKDNPKNIGKHPITENGLKDATIDKGKIKDWWTKHPNANLAIACGSVSGICVLDIDIDNEKNGLNTLLNYPDIEPTVKQMTGSGGFQHFFKYNKLIRSSVGKLGIGLDVRSDGGYVVVAPSMHKSGKRYEWITDQSPFEIAFANAPEWMFEKQNNFVKKPIEEKIISGKRNDTLTRIAGNLRRQGMSEQEIFISLSEINKNRCNPQLDKKEIEIISKSVSRYTPGEDILNEDNKKQKTLVKIVKIFEEDETLRSMFKYNVFIEEDEYARTPPWDSDKKSGDKVNDNDLVEIKHYISLNHGIEPQKTIINEALTICSRRNKYHPIRDYINGLRWDGINRLESWLIEYAGADNNKYIRAVSRKIIIAMIARVFDPGCKFDYMLVLEGDQGIKKSTLVKTLGGQWYSEIPIKEHNKDTIDAMLGTWVVEIGEMAGIKREDIEPLKAFISRPVDKVRLPYHHRSCNYLRQSVFIGTMNPEGDNTYFFDSTGNRRFWPVECKADEIDIKGLHLVKEQLFAEAKVMFDKGEELFLTDEEEIKLSISEQKNRQIKDPWAMLIEPRLNLKDSIYMNEILLDILKIPPERQNVSSLIKIGRVMKDLGWVKEREGHGERKWYYIRKG